MMQFLLFNHRIVVFLIINVEYILTYGSARRRFNYHTSMIFVIIIFSFCSMYPKAIKGKNILVLPT